MYLCTNNENVFLNVNNLIIMSQSINAFIAEVTKKNPNEPEFYRQFLKLLKL
jgi:glutamate dehydrogenase (NADP+)